jgi:L-2-hydroxyglutarate oxidase LhgO
MDKLDCVVVGAGVVGLAVARSLVLAGREVVVLEKEAQVGMHSSSRNSEVIHAGLYYADDSLKARLCVQGKAMLYAYSAAHHVACERIGKLIVASGPEDLPKLEVIARQARLNGVDDLRFLEAAEVEGLEPAVACNGALLSPSTGIVDSHALMTALEGEIEAHGGAVVLNSEVSDLEATDRGLRFQSGGEVFECRTLVNSAGLWADELLKQSRLKRSLRKTAPRIRYAIGHYYTYPGKSPFNHLVYPVPSNSGLGTHATNDLSGAVRFGPDVRWMESINYEFDDSCRGEFVEAIQRYYPALEPGKLSPGYTGIRPKLVGPGEPSVDFRIEGEGEHGVRGLINLFGMESPGLTACLAIGDYVREVAKRSGETGSRDSAASTTSR